jgi:hypothetical protein
LRRNSGFPCTTAMENLCSCDEIRGFQVGREQNRPCVGGFHVRPRRKPPKHKREKPGGFHVRPRRNPPKSATMGNSWFPCPAATETAQNRKRGKPGVSMFDRDESDPSVSVGNPGLPCPTATGAAQSKCEKLGASMSVRDRNRASVGNSGFPAPDAREPVRARKIRFSCVLSRQETTQVRENQGFPCRSRKNNRARAGKSEVSESVEKPTVQEWEIAGFHVQPRKKS